MKSSQYQITTLKIDGRDCSARSGDTVLEVAKEHGIFIQTLCHMDGLADVGACRLCLLEVRGSPKLMPACVTLVQEGMEITTDSPRLKMYRSSILELLFS